jgi:hypothetical protein
MESAIPVCLRRIVPKAGWHRTCFKAMRYDASSNAWLCVCGNIEAGELVAARRAAVVIEAAA